MIRISIGIIALMVMAMIIWQVRSHNHPNLLQSPADLASWQWRQMTGTVSGGVKLDQGAIRVDIGSVDVNDFDLLLYQRTVVLNNGHQYRISFSARSDKQRVIAVKATRNAWFGHEGTVGLADEFQIGPNWITCTTSFTAKNADTLPSRVPMFILGQTTGTVWLKDIVVQEDS